MHVDEAVQAYKFGELYEHHEYRYDPKEYHGPTLNYATLPSAWMSGAKTYADTDEFTYRIVPVVFGVATILLLFLIVDGLGWAAVILAGVLTAISPALVFYNRYYIHESLLVCFTFGCIAACWRYAQTRKTGWALLAGAFLGLMHATKETFVLSCAAAAVAVVCTIAWNRIRPTTRETRVVPPLRDDVKAWLPTPRALAAGVIVAVIVSAVLFSSFFTNAGGPLDSIRTYVANMRRAAGQGIHDHPWHFYLNLLVYFKEAGGPVWTEGLIVLLALVGCVLALWGRGFASPIVPSRTGSQQQTEAARGTPDLALARFVAFYTVVLTAIYAAIPYKTPWCMLTFLHGMILMAAIGAVAVVRLLPHTALKMVAGALLLVGMAHLGWEASRASFLKRYYADWHNPYVYAHTTNDVVNFEKRMDDLAQVHPQGYGMLVKVIAKDYWPAPWYVRRFKNVGYWNSIPEDPDAPVVITSSQPETDETNGVTGAAPDDIDAALSQALHGKYRKEFFGSRPGVFLIVYVNQDLWNEFVRRRTAAPPPDTRR